MNTPQKDAINIVREHRESAPPSASGEGLKSVFITENDTSEQALSQIARAEVMKKNRLTFLDNEGNEVEFWEQAAEVILNGERVKVEMGFAPQILVVDEVYGKHGHTFYAFKKNGDPILQNGEFNRFCINSRLSAFCNVGFGTRKSEAEKNVDVYNYDGEFMATLPYSDSDFDYSIIQTVQGIVAPGRSGKNSAKDFIQLYDELSVLEEDNDVKLQNLGERSKQNIDMFKKLMGPLKKYIEESRILHEAEIAKRKENSDRGV